MAVKWGQIYNYKPTALVYIWTEDDGTASDWNKIWIWVCRDGLVILSVNEADCLSPEYRSACQNGEASSFESKSGTHYYIRTGSWALRMFANTDKLVEPPAYYVTAILNQTQKYTKTRIDFGSCQYLHYLVKCWLEFTKADDKVYTYYK